MMAVVWIAMVLAFFVLYESIGAMGRNTGRRLYRAYKKRKES